MCRKNRADFILLLNIFLFLFFLSVSSYAQTASKEVKHPKGDYAVVNGAKIWYEIEGNGKPLLLIPGGPGAAHYFHPWFSVLSDSVKVIYFDAFGRGKSDRAKSPTEYTFDRDVEEIEGLRKALGIDKISVLGHSYGGMVAQAYALKYPNSVDKLVLLCTLFSAEMLQANNDNYNYEVRNQCPEIWDSLMTLRSMGLHSSSKECQAISEKVPAGLIKFYDASNAQKVTVDFNSEVYYAMAGDDADFLIGGDLAKLDFRTQLKSLNMPLLIMAGRFDRCALPRYSVLFNKYAPQAKFVMFEKSGHRPFVEETDSYFRILKSFLLSE